MKTRLLLVLILAAAIPATAQVIQPGFTPGHLLRCTYYAGPSGSASNSGKTSSSPIRISDFWALASAGDTLCLNSGTYQGSAQMIDPPSGLSGSSGSPITIRAINEGSVLIDGQFARVPISFNNNSHFVVEGVNARSSSGSLVEIHGQGTNVTRNITIRRVVVWDSNGMVEASGFGIIGDNTTDILLEDTATFGVFCRGYDQADSSDGPVTIRRAWADWQGYMAGGDCDTVPFHLNYSSTRGMTCENCIGQYSMHQQPFSFDYPALAGYPAGSCTNYQECAAGQPHLVRIRGPNTTANLFMAGSFFYALSTDRWSYNGVYTLGKIGPFDVVRVPASNFVDLDEVTIRDTYIYVSPSQTAWNNARGLGFVLPYNTFTAADNLNLLNTSTVTKNGNSVDSRSDELWNLQNNYTGTSVAAVPNPWTTTGALAGANLCKRWVDRTLTTEPLWPWPMNERIKAATLMSGRYTGPCQNCTWGDGGTQTQAPLRSAFDLTATVESILGTIPASCRS